MPSIDKANANDYEGLLDYTIKQRGAYHMIGDDDFEPQRNNNFELHVYFPNENANNEQVYLDTVENGIKIDREIAENTLIFSTVSVGGINTNVGIIPISYGNTKVKFAGLPEVADSTVVYNDYIGKATERIIAAWHAQVFNPITQIIGRASVYKKEALLLETAPDGTHVRGWNIKGCWPSNVTYGDYSYENGGQVRQINLTLTYDIAIPLDATTSNKGYDNWRDRSSRPSNI